jgi:hypothetical protein
MSSQRALPSNALGPKSSVTLNRPLVTGTALFVTEPSSPVPGVGESQIEDAKVGLEALIGVKTVGQIAREYQVHPVQVTQWKGVLREHLPELFETSRIGNEDSQELIAQLHEKIGQLSVEVDWLKKKCRQLGL